MRFKKICKIFNKGNVCVTGLRGTGKDVLFGNVIARSKKSYISNLDYTEDTRYLKFDFEKLNLGENTYNDILLNNIKEYVFPYPKGCDIYLSDAGVYFPSQYCNQLNNKYPYMPSYMALSRQVSHNNFHLNVQNLNRSWDKLREQSDIYIRCLSCKVIFGIVFQKIIIYDMYDACLRRVKPCRVKVRLFDNKQVRTQKLLHIDNFDEKNGNVKSAFLIYKNKSKHDTYFFEKLFRKEIKQ